MSPVTGVPMNLVPFILVGVCVAVLVVAVAFMFCILAIVAISCANGV